MLKTTELLLLLSCLLGTAGALYKQWVPDTNYENKTNWDKGDIPCGNDKVWFSAQRKVSVFVGATHAAREMRLPMDGEFILNSGAGFYVVAGQDPGCGQGVTTKFRDSESLKWLDPALWQGAATLDDLQRGNSLFSVHEESVPCRYDDVVFRDQTSFRVDTSSGLSTVPVKSVSVLGKRFESGPEFSQYLSSRSGRLQFHGSSAVTVGSPGCGDPSGCECGNSVNHDLICARVKCSPLSCKKPLSAVGHCCQVCGALVTVHFTVGFNLQTYRQRIQHLFLVLPKYESIQMAMSKVSRPQRLMGFVPFGSSSEIQVVLLDGQEGLQAEALARDILKDVRTHGSSLGITDAEFQASSGNSSDQSAVDAGVVVGAVIGALVLMALVITAFALVRKGVVRMPSVSWRVSLGSLRRSSDVGDLGGPLDHGFDNPMFDNLNSLPNLPGLQGNDAANSIAFTQAGGVFFINPAYDENETDFNA